MALQADFHAFLTGRQLMAVALIVIFTLLSDSISSVHPFSAQQANGWADAIQQLGAAITSQKTAAIFSFGFSTFIILWFAQLLPRFLVHENPLGFFCVSLPQWLFNIITFLDKTKLAVITESAMIRLKKFKLFQKGPILLPSRLHHYQNSAILQYGKGLESVNVTVRIAQDGHVEYSSSLRWKAFNVGVRNFTENHYWSSEIKIETCKIDGKEFPSECGEFSQMGPDVSDSLVGEKKTAKGKLAWDLHLQAELPVGTDCKYDVSYHTGPGACYTEINKRDFYEWVVHTPTAKLEVTVLPNEGCGFSLTDGKCYVGLEAPEKLEEERHRVTAKPLKRGYVYAVLYPLQGATYRFEWLIISPVIRPELPPIAVV